MPDGITMQISGIAMQIRCITADKFSSADGWYVRPTCHSVCQCADFSLDLCLYLYTCATAQPHPTRSPYHDVQTRSQTLRKRCKSDAKCLIILGRNTYHAPSKGAYHHPPKRIPKPRQNPYHNPPKPLPQPAKITTTTRQNPYHDPPKSLPPPTQNPATTPRNHYHNPPIPLPQPPEWSATTAHTLTSRALFLRPADS